LLYISRVFSTIPGTSVPERSGAVKEKEKEEKKRYEEPKILATYRKEELEELIKPHGSVVSYGGGGCGCGS
jgi:hypothetical protein